jgi:hypothetical protein
MSRQPGQLTIVKRALIANSLFSGLSGIIALTAHSKLSALIGLSRESIIFAIGLGLILYASWLAYVATRAPINASAVRAAVLADGGWVIGSIALVVLQPSWLTIPGTLLIGVVALIVALFAAIQWYGLRVFAQSTANT